MLYLGLDVHSKWFTLAGFDPETGECVKVPKVANTPEAIAATFALLPTGRHGVLESGTNALPMYRLLQPYFDTLIIVAPNKVWDRQRQTDPKTDLRDAYTLAEELAWGRLRPIYLPDDTLRAYRTLTRGRIEIAQTITRQVNHLYALLRGWGAPVAKKLLTKGGRTWLTTVTIPAQADLVLTQQVDRLETLLTQEGDLDTQIAALVREDTICPLLLTIPCVGPLTALVLRAEIGEIARFANADKLVAYAGLQPRVIQSGEHCRFGGLTKHGNAYLRYIAVLFAQNAIRSHQDTPFKRRFYRLAQTHHPNEIKVMVARDFLAVVHSMWRSQTVWQWPRPGKDAPHVSVA
jgi:transposase